MLSEKVKQEIIKMDSNERYWLIDNLIKGIEMYKTLIEDCKEYIDELTTELKTADKFSITSLKEIIEYERNELSQFKKSLEMRKEMLKLAKEIQGDNKTA